MLTELSKNKIKCIRSLQDKKSRDSEGLFIIEGEKMVKEALENYPELIHTLVQTQGTLPLSSADHIELFCCSESQLKQISTLKTPNKCIAITRLPVHSEPKLNGLIIALDGVQDPGNMGTILRTADWFGVQEIICSKDTVDCYNTKVVQASMGAIFRVKVYYLSLTKILQVAQLPVYGAFLEGNSVYEEQLSDQAIIVMGNEGKGIRKELESLITKKIMIPAFGKSESLNVSVATGIILSEFRRSS